MFFKSTKLPLGNSYWERYYAGLNGEGSVALLIREPSLEKVFQLAGMFTLKSGATPFCGNPWAAVQSRAFILGCETWSGSPWNTSSLPSPHAPLTSPTPEHLLPAYPIPPLASLPPGGPGNHQVVEYLRSTSASPVPAGTGLNLALRACKYALWHILTLSLSSGLTVRAQDWAHRHSEWVDFIIWGVFFLVLNWF